MEFFDKLGKKASETYKEAAQRTSKLAKETKLKILINDDKSKISDSYQEIGKKVYEKHIREEDINIKEELIEECSKIDVLSDEIETARMDILNLRDKKQCPHCFYEIDLEYNYCPNCGEKQEKEEQEAKEVEILEEQEDVNSTDNNEIDN